MNPAANSFYSQKSGEYSVLLQSVTKKLKRFAWYRFFTFLFIFAPLFIFGLKSWFTLIFSFAAIILFFFLVKKNIQLERIKRYYSVLKKITENELVALNHQFSHFKNGTEFLNTDHFFSYDLDLFGEGSLFQFINRTTTTGGQQKLAGWLIQPFNLKEEILQRQEAIRELAQLHEWRLQFLAEGQMFEETRVLHEEIFSWAGFDLKLKKASLVKRLIFITPVLTIISAIPAFIGIGNLFLWIMIFVQWIFLTVYWKKISDYFQFFGRKSELLSKYVLLLRLIEDQSFKSVLLKQMQNKVRQPESAGKIFRQLKRLVEQFEFRQNILVGFFMNSLFLWDIRCVYRLWEWHHRHHNNLTDWLEVISESDALISLANFANNQNGFVYPEISENDFCFKANELGHPLLHENKRVCNDFEIEGLSKVMIVTGANMAGKSTFLRSVGVNLILAGTGAPVCAEKMVFTPIELYTNMRTTDSLLKDESYFFAELKRIKGVLDLLQKGERIFVILDEMLKGTNSTDKLNGSKELIHQLISLKTHGIVATHDLGLTELVQKYPSSIKNQCFEVLLHADELKFDYKLSEEVTRTMNATCLMKKMRIIQNGKNTKITLV